MEEYTHLTEREKEILLNFPKLTQEELDAANDLFAPYIFYQSEPGGRRVWTSCCHKNGEFLTEPQRIETIEMRDVLYGAHGERVKCPWCGRDVTLKCRGRVKSLQNKDNVPEGQVLFLRATPEGSIYAQGYWMQKNYVEYPADYPKYQSSLNYFFEPGRATMFYRDYWTQDWTVEIEQYRMGRPKKVCEPFSRCGLWPGVVPYSVIGMDELDKSFARYCNYRAFYLQDAADDWPMHDDLIRFLCIACVYPRQLEMLNKSGQLRLINDLMWEGKKNARIFAWEETDPRRAFGLSGQELKKYLARGDDLNVLEARKATGCSFEAAEEWFSDLYGFRYGSDIAAFAKSAKRHGLKVDELRKYLLRYTGPRCGGRGFFTLECAWQMWTDYLVNAEAVGFDLAQRSVLLPRDLEGAHDNAAALLQEQKAKADKAKGRELSAMAKKRADALDKRYGFETEHFFIRAPRSTAEIVREGRILHHCVGGYADRHARGEATFLFLRDKAHPMTPLCTIQVLGDRLIQIHGYNDERQPGAVRPQLRFAEIYTPWLRWLNAGQPRDKKGTPRVPKIKERKTA